MSSMTMWYLVLLAAVLPVVPTVAEVVEKVSDCDQFLLDRKPLDVTSILKDGKMDQNRYKFICQTFKDEKRFLTLYDTENKIPVYSAYKYRGQKEKAPKKHRGQKEEGPKKHRGQKEKAPTKRPWMIEPQLEGEETKNMCDTDFNTDYKKQAGLKDYRKKEGAEFNKGHLIPFSYGSTTEDRISTCTLTNIVPQAITFNGGSWSRMEKCVKCVMDEYCKDNNGHTEAYVVTGAIPSVNEKLNGKINIPTKLWSAFCCQISNSEWIAGAHWGENVSENESKKTNKKYLKTETLEKLYEELKINVFPETQCPRQTTITKIYPNSKDCSCPPPS